MTDDILEPKNHQGKLVVYYRKRHNMSRAKLAELLDVDVSTVYRMEQQDVIKDIKRRQLLVGLLGIPASLMSLDEAIIHKIISPLMLNQDHMAFFEQELATHWDIYHTGGTTRAFQGLHTWIQEMREFAEACTGGIWHKRAHTALCLSYQLQGSIYRDLMEYKQAHMAYSQALCMAKDLYEPELMASSLARKGVTCIQQRTSTRAIPYLEEALRLVDGEGLPCLRGYILQALSEAYAMNQQHKESMRSIELAERALERKGTVLERSHCQLNTTSVVAQKGINAVLLHDNVRAISLIEKGLANYDPTLVRGRARLLAQKAEAYYGIGSIDNCVATAQDACAMARSVGSKKTIMRIELLHESLSQSYWGKERSVVQLGTLLVAHS